MVYMHFKALYLLKLLYNMAPYFFPVALHMYLLFQCTAVADDVCAQNEKKTKVNSCILLRLAARRSASAGQENCHATSSPQKCRFARMCGQV